MKKTRILLRRQQCYALCFLLVFLALLPSASTDGLPSQGPSVRLLRLLSSTTTEGDSSSRSQDLAASRGNLVKEDSPSTSPEEDISWTDSDDHKIDLEGDLDLDSDSDVKALDGKKRKWEGKGMNIWGKRGQWAKNNLQLWGKRNFDPKSSRREEKNYDLALRTLDDVQEEPSEDSLFTGEDYVEEKRNWAKNGMKIWGKRGEENLAESDEKRSKWAKNEMKIWGKRSDENLAERDEKRKWAKNEMKIWGKRGDENSAQSDEKRKWAKNEMKIWGKRGVEDEAENYEKRNWAKNGMNIWGKRRSESSWDPVDLSNNDPYSSAIDNSWSHLDPYSKRGQQAPERTNSPTRRPTPYIGFSGVWGKFGPYPSGRNYPKRFVTLNGIKKGWASNNMRIWGK